MKESTSQFAGIISGTITTAPLRSAKSWGTPVEWFTNCRACSGPASSQTGRIQRTQLELGLGACGCRGGARRSAEDEGHVQRQGGEEGAGGGQRRGEGAPGCSFLREHEAGNLRQALRERRP